jgi:DNA-binding GntR family transcriptional regulator
VESKPASVLKAIRAEIIAGTLARGARLKEDALAEQFGVSRVPVREALRQLESEGFVVSEKFKGVRVADSSVEVVIELMQIRRGLEVLAAELAAASPPSAPITPSTTKRATSPDRPAPKSLKGRRTPACQQRSPRCNCSARPGAPPC